MSDERALQIASLTPLKAEQAGFERGVQQSQIEMQRLRLNNAALLETEAQAAARLRDLFDEGKRVERERWIAEMRGLQASNDKTHREMWFQLLDWLEATDEH